MDSRRMKHMRRFEFQKRGQLFICPHNETLSVAAMRFRNPDPFAPLRPTAATQPKLQPALLRLSAMISQYFTRF
jgi:hypothetical protein